MAFGGMGGGGGPMSEINTTPLVDVMLVLLVVFIMIAPMVTHRIKVNLPEMTTDDSPAPPQIVTVAIDADGNLFWDQTPVSNDELVVRLDALHRDVPEAELHVSTDDEVTYERLSFVLGKAQLAKVVKIGFVKPSAL